MREAVKFVAPVLSLMLLPFLAAPHAGAQEMPDPPDREELVEFTKAYLEVMEVREEMEERMMGAATQEEAQQIQMEANQKMVAVIEEHEFTPQRYTEITNILNADEELREEFEQIYRELIEDKDGPLL
jgi:hypothetical protein